MFDNKNCDDKLCEDINTKNYCEYDYRKKYVCEDSDNLSHDGYNEYENDGKVFEGSIGEKAQK